MNTDEMPENNFEHRQVKFAYKVTTFYAHCPDCGHARKCRHEDDGSFSLICGCKRDGANAITYLISAHEVSIHDEDRIKYLDVPIVCPPEAKED